MPKLFAIYIGGSVPGAHLELHDLRFCIGDTIEDCFAHLKKQWWGTPESLHLDAWGALQWTDGHSIEVSTNPIPSKHKLWLVHLGGYDPKQFTELHENLFLIAENEQVARKRGIEKVKHWFSPHKDALLEVENMIDIGAVLGDKYHLHLTPNPEQIPFRFEARYVPIGKMS